MLGLAYLLMKDYSAIYVLPVVLCLPSFPDFIRSNLLTLEVTESRSSF